MPPVANRGSGRWHVFYAYLARFAGGFGWALRLVASHWVAGWRIKTTLLRLMHLLPHKAP
jgi:hypothetical protein